MVATPARRVTKGLRRTAGCEPLHTPILPSDLDLLQRESIKSRRWTQMTRAAVFLLMLLAGCSEEKPRQAVNEMIESPLQNTVISSFDTYPPKRATQGDLDLVASIPSACVGKGQPLRLLSSAPR